VEAESVLLNSQSQASGERVLLPMLTLILGPSGGGKSRWAEHLALHSARPVIYLATGPCLSSDVAWQRKLASHRARRPASWLCLEVEGELAGGIARMESTQVCLVDSLGTWVAAWLDQDRDGWEGRCEQLLEQIRSAPGPLLVVAEEVGWSVVPATAEGMRFQQRLTTLLQRLQPLAARTWLVVANRALDLDQLGMVVPPSPDVCPSPAPAAPC
jgi:adenosylcobinamide kinase / adenosylcobinamide-phosphate guanylyltransferase